MSDTIINALIDNPDLLAIASGKTWTVASTYQSCGRDMVSLYDGGATFYNISVEKLKTDPRFCEYPAVKAYLETLYQ